MSETTDEASPAPGGPGAPMRPRPSSTRRISRGNLWGILQGRLHVPLGDLRRQFQIDSDEVTPIHTSEGTFYVGLPADGAAVLGQLWHEGRIVFDCTPDLRAMVVRAIAPTRPTRPPPSRTPTARSGVARTITSDATPSAPLVADRRVVARPVTPTRGTEVSYTSRPTSGRLQKTVGFEEADEFLPVPNVEAFESVDIDLQVVSLERPGSLPDPMGAGPEVDVPVPDEVDGPASGDDSGRRRRRGGIGRAARSR